MNIFEDVSRFLEQRLEEFLRQHPHLELQVLDEKLREQVRDTQRLIQELQTEEKQEQAAILTTAQEIQRWHQRIGKAQRAGRQDLAQAAQEREAALLRQGNQQWGHMEVIHERIKQAQQLHQNMQVRQQEVQAKMRQLQAEAAQHRVEEPPPDSRAADRGWSQPYMAGQPDPLEETFQRWETEEELEQLKREMGRR